MACACTVAGAAQPNVLMVSFDDLAPRLGCYGDALAHTPNLDRLAQRGVRFTRAYAQFPVCAASRVSFLSGWLPETSLYYDIGQDTRSGPLASRFYLPEWFKHQGYTTARLDKVFHIGDDEPSCWTITEEPFPDSQGNPVKVVNQTAEPTELGLAPHILRQEEVGGFEGVTARMIEVADTFPANSLTDGRTATRAVSLLNQFAASGEPFFLAVGFRRPHVPCIANSRHYQLHPLSKFPPPVQDPSRPPLNETNYRKAMQSYFAAISHVDEQFGRLLDTLDSTGLASNTIIVIFGDHGFNLTERANHYGKGTLYERSLWTPLIIAVPGSLRAGTSCAMPVGLMDIYPTLVALAGLPAPPQHLQGRDLGRLLEGDESGWEGISYSSYKTLSRHTLRTPRFRYVESFSGVPVELFDLDNDPYEHVNVVSNPAYGEALETLRARLADFFRFGSFTAPPPNLSVSGSVNAVAGSPSALWVSCSGPAPRSYEWRRNGVLIAGAVDASLRFDPAATTDSASYTCIIRNAYGSLVSPSMTLTVSNASAGASLILDNSDAGVSYVGSARLATSGSGFFGNDFFTATTGSGTFARYSPALSPGDYRIETWFPSSWSNASPSVPYTVRHAGGATVVAVNQASAGGAWRQVGTGSFMLDQASTVEIGSNLSSGRSAFDAMRFVRLDSPPDIQGDGPVAGEDGPIDAPWGQVIEIDVLANDSAPSGSALSIGEVLPASHGTVSLVGSRIRYTPAPGAPSGDVFHYRAVAGGLSSSYARVQVRPQAPRYSDWQAQQPWWNSDHATPLADPEVDGEPNVVAYALRRDPLRPENANWVEALPGSSPGTMRFRYLRRRALEDVTIRHWMSADLAVWTEVPAASIQRTDVPGDPDALQVDITADTAGGRTFLRLEVVGPE